MVPFADRVMAPIRRSSTLITSNRRAISVLALSAQSLRRSVSRARSRAIAWLDPGAAVRAVSRLASFRSSLRSLARSRAARPGHVQELSCRQGGGDRHAPIDSHDLAVAWCGNRVGDGGEGDVPAPGSVPGHPVGLHPRRHRRDQRNRTHPAFGTQHLAACGTPGVRAQCLPRARRSGTLHPARPCATSAAGRVRRSKNARHRLGEVPQRLLLHRLGARGQPWMLCPRCGELPALHQVARRACPAWPPLGMLLDGQVPHEPGMGAMVPQHRLLGARGNNRYRDIRTH